MTNIHKLMVKKNQRIYVSDFFITRMRECYKILLKLK